MLEELRTVLPPKGGMVAVVGAGGKTTCIYGLSRRLLAEGATVLVTTTTKIFHPNVDQPGRCRVMTGNPDCLLDVTPNQKGMIDVLASKEAAGEPKLLGFTREEVEKLRTFRRYDFILVEADGAKQKPVKAPAQHEPVIPTTTDLIIGLIGLSCLGLPLADANAHRATILATITGQTLGSLITLDTLQALILSPAGLLKGAARHSRKLVVLNQADNLALKRQGIEIGKRVLKAGETSLVIERVLVGALKPPV